MTRKHVISGREWALFGIRWFIPVGLLLCLLLPDAWRLHGSLIVALSLLGIVSNLIVLLLIWSDRWSQAAAALTVFFDLLLALVAIAGCGTQMLWAGFIPVAVAGTYFNWLPGAIAGVIISAGEFIIYQTQPLPALPNQDVGFPLVIFALVSLPITGALVALLSRNQPEMEDLKYEINSVKKQAEQITNLAIEYMKVVYELTDVLSAAKVDTKRVLKAAVSFSLEGLERVGIRPPLYGAILLFSKVEGSNGPVLRVAEASSGVPGVDRKISVPGISGALAKTLANTSPAMTCSPDVDPELSRFESFGRCGTVVCLPLRSGNESYGTLLIGSLKVDAFKELHVEMMRAVANQAASSLNNARLYGALLEQRDRLVEVEKAARSQLANELHDGPTQGIAAVTMRLNSFRRLMEKKPERAIEEIYTIEDLAHRTSKEIRHMLFELRPKALDRGLTAGLEQLVNKTTETFDQKIALTVEPDVDNLLDSHATQTLFSIAAETLTNARKHAQADLITIYLGVRDDVLLMDLRDNGVGFDVEAKLADAQRREGHLGLVNLQERATLIDGTLQIESAPGEGTRTMVYIPLEVLLHRKEEEQRRLKEKEDAITLEPRDQI